MIILFLAFRLIFCECPSSEWSHNLANNKCYRAFESGKEASWNQAESVCQSFGGDLTSILDRGELDFVYSVINRRSYDYYWIGLNGRVRKKNGSRSKKERKWNFKIGFKIRKNLKSVTRIER